MSAPQRNHARAIWDAAVDAVRPAPPQGGMVDLAKRSSHALILVPAAAGAAMAVQLKPNWRAGCLEGIVNVPADAIKPLRKFVSTQRPAATNFPTADGVRAGRKCCACQNAGPNDVTFCLLSGGGSRFAGVGRGRVARGQIGCVNCCIPARDHQ